MIFAYLAMMIVVAASNYLVQFPINDWLTFGAFTYPISFLVTEITNLYYGPQKARRVVYIGFLLAFVVSIQLATFKIASASCFAFLTAQLLDILIFNRLRSLPWWYAPILASFAASATDTLIFWNLAFYGEPLPILTWSLGDLSVKLGLDVFLLAPFRTFLRTLKQPQCLTEV